MIHFNYDESLTLCGLFVESKNSSYCWKNVNCKKCLSLKSKYFKEV